MTGERDLVLNQGILKVPAGYPQPKDILGRHFLAVKDALSIKGGWGYTMDDACIVIVNDEEEYSDDISELFFGIGDTLDGIEIENLFIHCRILEELEYAHPAKYYGMAWQKMGQKLITDALGTPYDLIPVNASAFREEDWRFLNDDLEKHGNYENDAAGKAHHDLLREERIIRFSEEFWFNISNFF